MIRLYNVLRKFCYLPKSNETELVVPETDESVDSVEENVGLNKGTVKRVGGYSGHHLYQSVSS